METPPVAKRKPHEMSIHGERLVDHYHYFKLVDCFFQQSCFRNKEDEEVKNYIKKENKYFEDSYRKGAKDIEEKLFEELKSRIRENNVSVPFKLQNSFYYSKNEKGKEYRYIFRNKTCPPQKAWGGDVEFMPEIEGDQLLLDVNKVGEGKDHCSLGTYETSINENLFIYSIDFSGNSQHNIYVKDLKKNEIIDKIVDQPISYNLAISSTNKSFYYLLKDKKERNYRLMNHRIGDDGHEKDKLIYEEKDEKFHLSLSKTISEKYILLNTYSETTSEWLYLDAFSTSPKLTCICSRSDGIEYEVAQWEDQWIILHNSKDESTFVNFRIICVPISTSISDLENASEKFTHVGGKVNVPYDSSRYIFQIKAFKTHLCFLCRENGFVKLYIHDMKSKKLTQVKFDETNSDTWFSSNFVYDTTHIRVKYTSLITPISIYDVNLSDSSDRKLLKTIMVDKKYQRENYATHHFLVPSSVDKSEIPVSLVYKKKIHTKAKEEERPCIVYAYGAYGSSVDCYFRKNVISLLDRGFVYVLAHVRGGAEKGRLWYLNGKLKHKENTFRDLIDVCDEIRSNGSELVGTPLKINLYGVSAGGLLAQCVNLRPELFHACVFDVPFVDLIWTMMDDSIPLTVREYEQWGNPKKKEFFEIMKRYSPIDNLNMMWLKKKNNSPNSNKKKKKREEENIPGYFPAMFVNGSINDSSVQYFEPLKYVAKTRYLLKNNPYKGEKEECFHRVKCRKLVLRIDMKSGHGGASGRYEHLREQAMIYAFFVKMNE